MVTPDLVNGLWEAFGSLFILGHVRRALKDKLVRGVWWPATAFFMGWGYWNVYFYPISGLWWSFVGGLFIVATNTVWLALLGYYLWRERHGFEWFPGRQYTGGYARGFWRKKEVL